MYEAPLALIGELPATCGGVFVLRHSARYPIETEEDVYGAGLTPEGVQQAERLGAELQPMRRPGRLLSSPVTRCLDTAAAIARGAGWDKAVQADYRLSHPFIEPAWNALPLAWGKDPLPVAIGRLLDLIVAGERAPGTLDLLVTHDTIVSTLAEYFTGVHFEFPEVWPDFLEGVLFWQNDGELHVRWREQERVIGPWPAPGIRQLSFDFPV